MPIVMLRLLIAGRLLGWCHVGWAQDDRGGVWSLIAPRSGCNMSGMTTQGYEHFVYLVDAYAFIFIMHSL